LEILLKNFYFYDFFLKELNRDNISRVFLKVLNTKMLNTKAKYHAKSYETTLSLCGTILNTLTTQADNRLVKVIAANFYRKLSLAWKNDF